METQVLPILAAAAVVQVILLPQVALEDLV
jgi:hypothetical protein